MDINAIYQSSKINLINSIILRDARQMIVYEMIKQVIKIMELDSLYYFMHNSL